MTDNTNKFENMIIDYIRQNHAGIFSVEYFNCKRKVKAINALDAARQAIKMSKYAQVFCIGGWKYAQDIIDNPGFFEKMI
jgi:hypothetical protein